METQMSKAEPLTPFCLIYCVVECIYSIYHHQDGPQLKFKVVKGEG